MITRDGFMKMTKGHEQVKELAMWTTSVRAFLAEETSSKALRWEYVWCGSENNEGGHGG